MSVIKAAYLQTLPPRIQFLAIKERDKLHFLYYLQNGSRWCKLLYKNVKISKVLTLAKSLLYWVPMDKGESRLPLWNIQISCRISFDPVMNQIDKDLMSPPAYDQNTLSPKFESTTIFGTQTT